jgi:PAS domain S-box-containing protein
MSAGQITGLFGTVLDITARKTTELALQVNERRYAALAELAPVGIFRNDAAGAMVYGNQRWCEITGLTLEQGLGAGWVNCVHPDWRESFFDQWFAMTQGGPDYAVEGYLRHADGTLKWIYCQAQPERDEGGNVIGYIGTVTDISRLKQAEDELKEREALFRSVFEQDAVAMAIVAPDHQFLQINRRFCEFFGYDEADLKSLTFRELTYPDDLANSAAALVHLAQGDISNISMEKRYVRQDGTVVWSNTTVAAVRDQAGNLLYNHALLEDITERKRLEIELQQSQAFLQSVYEGTAVGIGVLAVLGEDQYRYIDANPAIARIAGVPDGFLKGKTIEDLQPFFTPAGYAHLLVQYRHCVTTKESLQFEVNTTREGQEVWWLTEINPLINGDGQVTELIVSMFSISDRKQAEQALQHLNAELEQRIQERTQALLDSQTELKIKEAQYRSIFETVGEGIFINDLDTGAVVEVNPAACQMHGYERNEFLSVLPTTYVHPDSHHVFTEFMDALSQDQSFTGEAKGVRKDGSCFDAEVTGRRIFFNGKYHALGTVRDVTERNVAERAQQRLVSLIENNQDFIGISTLNHDPLFLNTAGLSLVGLSSIEEMQAYRLRDFFFPEDWAKLDEILALLAEVGTWHGEFRMRHFKTGELIEVEVNLYRSGGQDPNNPPCVAVSARDIRDRKRAERDRQNLVSLIENSSDFIGISTLNCEPLFLNAAGMALVGLDSIAEMQTYRLTDFFFPEDLPALDAQISQLSGRGKWEGEFRMRHFKTGAVLDIEVRLYLLGSGEPEDPLCVAAVARDIRERKQAEQERQKLISLLETSRDFIGVATLAGRPLFINAAGLAMVGLENFEVAQAHPINDYFMPESLTIQRDQILPTVMAQDNWQGEVQFRHFQTVLPLMWITPCFCCGIQSPKPRSPWAPSVVILAIANELKPNSNSSMLN